MPLHFHCFFQMHALVTAREGADSCFSVNFGEGAGGGAGKGQPQTLAYLARASNKQNCTFQTEAGKNKIPMISKAGRDTNIEMVSRVNYLHPTRQIDTSRHGGVKSKYSIF